MQLRLTVTSGTPVLLTLFLLFSGCRGVVRTPQAPAASPQTANAGSTFQSPSGRTYRRIPAGPINDNEPITAPSPGTFEPHAVTGDMYRGTARRAAKLSLALGPLQSFTDLGAVLDSLPADQTMRALNISKAATSARFPEEDKNVTVTAFLYASSKESDNDYHCIVGRDPGQPARYMNVEVSGLPPANSQFITQLQAARNQYKTFFTTNGNALPTGGYDRYDPPIPIKVTGSLFFDVDHIPPAVGPTGMKPVTAWEIHPVSDIEFEPNTP